MKEFNLTGRRKPRRANLTGSIEDLLVKFSGGNPGAATTLMSIIQYDFLTGCRALMVLDELGIYGSRLYMLWNDCCDRNPKKVIRVLDAYLSGHLESETIDEHIDQGRGVPFSNNELGIVDCPWR